MRKQSDIEDDFDGRSRYAYYLYGRVLDGKISIDKYFEYLGDNLDVLTSEQWDELEAWKIEKDKEAVENSKKEALQAFKDKQIRQTKDKENENLVIYILAFIGLIILIMMAITGNL